MSESVKAAAPSFTPEIEKLFEEIRATRLADWAALKTKLCATGWFTVNEKNLETAFQFCIASAGQLVSAIDSATVSGADKKAAVVSYLKTLFMGVFVAEVPIELQPVVKLAWSILSPILCATFEAEYSKLKGLPVTPVAPAPAPVKS